MRGGLYRNPGGKVWLFELRWRGKKRKGSTMHESRPAAEKWLAKKKKDWADEEVGLYEGPPITLADAFAEWDRLQKGQVAALYRVNMRCAVHVHAAAYLDRPLAELDNKAIEEIRVAYLATPGKGYRRGQDWEAERAHTPGGANGVVKNLSALVGWCLKKGLIKARPFTGGQRKAQEKAKAILWPEQVQPLLAVADKGGKEWASPKPRPVPDSATAIRLMVGLGLRETEALNARWEWLQCGVYTVGKTKNRKLRRIEVPDWLQQHLEVLRAAAGSPNSGLIIPAREDEEGNQFPHHKTFTQKPVERCGRSIKILGLTPHCLRATFATTHFEVGTTISQIQLMLGHKDPSTTMKYIHQRPKGQAQAQEAAAKAMGFLSRPHTAPSAKPKKKPSRTKKAV
jgi:integrase